MSVANSMGMTVVERTREIGTLRAIGLKCGAGLLLTLVARWGINATNISHVPPNSVSPVPLLIDMDSSRIVFTFILMSLVGLIATYLPARRAAHKDIIGALGHV